MHGKFFIPLIVLSALGLAAPSASAAPLSASPSSAASLAPAAQPVQYFSFGVGVDPYYDDYGPYRPAYSYGYYGPSWRYRHYYRPHYYRSYRSYRHNPYYERRSGIRHERSPN